MQGVPTGVLNIRLLRGPEDEEGLSTGRALNNLSRTSKDLLLPDI